MFDPEPRFPPLRDNGALDTDEEWTDEDDVADLTQQQPGKFNEAIANEVRLGGHSNSMTLQLLLLS